MDPKKAGMLRLFLFLGVLVLIAGWLGFGERGLFHLYEMDKERHVYRERIQRLQDENQRLIDEIKRLRDDREYIEAVARKELGLIKDNEFIYRFSEE